MTLEITDTIGGPVFPPSKLLDLKNPRHRRDETGFPLQPLSHLCHLFIMSDNPSFVLQSINTVEYEQRPVPESKFRYATHPRVNY